MLNCCCQFVIKMYRDIIDKLKCSSIVASINIDFFEPLFFEASYYRFATFLFKSWMVR